MSCSGIHRRILVACMIAVMPSCGLFSGKKKSDDGGEPATVLVGRIASIQKHGGFVLIESYGAWQVETGAALWSGDEEHPTALQVTGEKLGQFAAADIRSGAPVVGDAVFQRLKAPQKEVPAVNPADENGKKPADAPAKPVKDPAAEKKDPAPENKTAGVPEAAPAGS